MPPNTAVIRRLQPTLLGPADYRVMPWKNGKGSTTEIAIHPAGAGLKDFLWRVSLAEVGEDGDFSSFPGCDRSIMVAAGAGMELQFNGEARSRLEGPGAWTHFSGDWHTRCVLLDGPVRDFNVMSARAHVHHECEPVMGEPVEFVWEPHGETLLCYCVSGTLVLKARRAAEWQLAPGQSLLLPAERGRHGLMNLMVVPHTRGTLGAVVRLRAV